MLRKKQDSNEFEIINILEMAQIIYNDGKKDIFEAVQIADKGVYTGRIRNNEFIRGGFIPKRSIIHIISNGKNIFI